jgi:aryl-phospho-beta-D-glucosidase BglC (GH1 family)
LAAATLAWLVPVSAADAFRQNERMGRGVNIIGWDRLWQDRARGDFKDEHFRLIHEAGFSHVRINLHPLRDGRPDAEGNLRNEFFTTLDWAIDQALANKLLVVLDYHDDLAISPNPAGKKSAFLASWAAIAGHCQGRPSEVLFEILNEPAPRFTHESWSNYWSEALAIIRRSNPARTVIIGPDPWNSFKQLESLHLPEEDRNLIVTFHYYDPFAFTHQGTPWTGQRDKTGVSWQGAEKERQAIEQDFETVQAWAKQQNRPIYLGEFGAYEKGDMDSRARWTAFVARQAGMRGWSWAYWQFAGDFVLFDMASQKWVQPIREALVPPPRALKKGDVVYEADFESADALGGWSGAAVLEPGCASPRAVALENKANVSGAIISRQLPAEALRGCRIRGAAMVRAEQVSPKPNPWNGIKFMLITESPAGKSYPQATVETGAFDWRRAGFTASVPADATNVTLVLGLEQVTGKVWFDDLKLTVAKAPITVQPKPMAGPVFKGHSLPRLRGAMVSPNIDAESLRVLGQEWNANLIRFQLIRSGRVGQPAMSGGYDAWLEGELKRLDAILPLCEQYGLFVVVDLHSPPGGKATAGGYLGSDSGLFSDRQAQEKFVEVWRRIAGRYKDAKAIWGYDLANEPVEDQSEDTCDDWQALSERAARAIRAIDPERAIILEPSQWGSPEGLTDLVPIAVSNVVYSVHMYLPHAFTHQGVFGPGPAYRYPGLIDGKHWDKAQLERALQPAIAFQDRYHVHIYIGEFSAIRWAPDNSARRYLGDLIDIFEAHGWDWSYHAFREWSGWSVEHGPDRQDTRPATSPTERQRLLCDWFARNQKPRW